jgi:imidazolonepropionase-like amidohydrolase
VNQGWRWPWPILMFGSLVAAGIAAAPTPAAEPPQAFRLSAIWTGEGEPLSDAGLLVIEGRVAAVGAWDELALPEGTQVHHLRDQVMIPGLVVAETAVGGVGDAEQALTPHLLAADGFDVYADFSSMLAAGVTTIQVSPGSRRLVPGQGGVLRLAGGTPDQRWLSRAESLRVMLTASAFNPPTIYQPPVGAVSEVRPLEPVRPQLAGSLAGAVAGLRTLLSTARLVRTSEDVDELELLGPLWQVLDGELPLRLTARTAAEIQAAAGLLEECQVTALLVDPLQLSSAGSEIMLDHFRGFLLRPPTGPGRLRDDLGPKAGEAFWEIASWLSERGLRSEVALAVDSESDLLEIRFLAALLRRAGWSDADILATLTSNAARLLGVHDRVGTLQVGLEADFVLLSGAPFSPNTQVLGTYISGQRVYRGGLVGDGSAAPILIRAESYFDGRRWHRSRSQLLVVDGRLAAVGEEVSYPASTTITHFPAGAVVVPGTIDLSAQLGMGGSLSDRLGIEVKLADQLLTGDETALAVRRLGVTSALVGSSRLPSPVMAIKLTDTPRVLADPVALRFEISGNLSAARTNLQRTLERGEQYAKQWDTYDRQYAEYEAALKAYKQRVAEKSEASSPPAGKESPAEGGGESATGGDTGSGPRGTPPEEPDAKPSKDDPAKPTGDDPAKPADEEPQPPKKPTVTAALEPYRAVFAGRLPLIVEAQQQQQIALAVELVAERFGLPLIVAGGMDAVAMLPRLKEAGVKLAVGPDWWVQLSGERLNLAQQAATAGVPFGFQSAGGLGSGHLPEAIRYLTYHGLSVSDALAAASAAPAEWLGLAERVGSLRVGADADLVVLSGAPDDAGTEVLAVMIDGDWVYRRGEP